MRRVLAVCGMLFTLLAVRPCLARGGLVLVEISDAAESLLDARATRRLVALELADIDVPAPVGANQRAPAPLFFRVVQVERDLRVELWERGEYHGARVVSGTNAAGQLAARRVALAAAELARRLQRKRQLQAARERKESAARAAAQAAEARRALNGPFALRSGVELVDIGSMAATLVGPRLTSQWALAAQPRLRLEVGVALLAGSAPAHANGEWLELSGAGLRRVALAETLDLDLGVLAAAAWVRLARVRAVDAIPDQSETWSSRAALVARLEPRLSRHFRLSLGAEGGLVLRQVPFEPEAGGSERLRGLWLGLGLGVVFTPR